MDCTTPQEVRTAPMMSTSFGSRSRLGPREGSLRSSCEACASSKVKCSGSKPSCHRCQKRGFKCQYHTAKRAGRKAASTIVGSSDTSVSSLRQSQDAERSTEVTFTPPTGTPSESSDCLRDFFSGMDTAMGPVLTQTDSNYSDMDATFLDLSNFDFNSAEDLWSSASDGNITNGNNALVDPSFGSNDAMAELLAFPLPTPEATTTTTSPIRDVPTMENVVIANQGCACQAQALSLLTQLSQLLLSTGNTLWTADSHNSTAAIEMIQNVLIQNQLAVETINTVSTCPSAHDGHLLVIISLTLFRIMGLFAAIVIKSPACPLGVHSRSTSTSSVSSSSDVSRPASGIVRIEGKDWIRMSAQAALGELHKVGSLTKLVSAQLQTEAARPKEREAHIQTLSIYGQLEVDLHKGLKKLSQCIIDRLRRF